MLGSLLWEKLKWLKHLKRCLKRSPAVLSAIITSASTLPRGGERSEYQLGSLRITRVCVCVCDGKACLPVVYVTGGETNEWARITGQRDNVRDVDNSREPRWPRVCTRSVSSLPVKPQHLNTRREGCIYLHLTSSLSLSHTHTLAL